MPDTLNSHHPHPIVESDRQDWSEATQDLLDALPPIWTRGLVYLLAIATGISLIWASVGKFQQTVTLSGEILPQKPPLKIDTPVTAKVVQVLVKSGDRVKNGQTLIELDRSKIAATTAGTIHQLILYPGEVVKAGETLVQIIPNNNDRKWQTQIDVSQIRGLKIGLPVTIEVLYEDKYPTLSGKVSQILPSSSQPNTYDLEVAIAQTCDPSNLQCIPPKIGQIATAKIQIRHTHLINLIFNR